MKNNERAYNMKFADVYPLYVKKVERKGRNEEEVRELLTWLTGYSEEDLDLINSSDLSMREFFEKSPNLNEERHFITGSICGVKIQEIEEPLMKEIRYMDKIIDELANGKDIEKIKVRKK